LLVVVEVVLPTLLQVVLVDIVHLCRASHLVVEHPLKVN
jgi:hypothetical protein